MSRLQPVAWLDEQRDQQRQLFLIIDRLAEPDPVQQLFAADLMQDYLNLYQGGELDDLADIGPWLVRLPDSHAPLLHNWLTEPDRHTLYRFQDSRVMAHHLLALRPEQRSGHLGQLSAALCRDGKARATQLVDEQRRALSRAQQRLLAQAQRSVSLESVFGDLCQRADLPELVSEWRAMQENRQAEQLALITAAPIPVYG
ncbi:hypothetical protein D9M70_287910 [compost metagenome]